MKVIELADDLSLKRLDIGNFPKTSILYVNRSNFDDVYDKVSKVVPLLTNKWLVYIKSGLSENNIVKLFKVPNCIVIYSTNRDITKLELSLRGEGIVYSLVDNIHYKDEDVINYIIDELHISEKLAKKIAYKCNYYYVFVAQEVAKLKIFEEITEVEIDKYVERHNTVNLYKIVYHLLGIELIKPSSISKYLYKYKYSYVSTNKYTSLRDSLLKILEDMMEIYVLIYRGDIGADNYKSFKYKKDMKLSKYQIRKILLDVYKVVDYTKILALYKTLSSENNVLPLLSLL